MKIVQYETAESVKASMPSLLAQPLLGCDTEFLGLDVRQDRLRLVQLSTPDIVYVFDCFKLNPRLLQPVLDNAKLIAGHNLNAELHYLWEAGLNIPANIGSRLYDSMLAQQILYAGTEQGLVKGANRLDTVAAMYGGTALDKSYQLSDWSGELSQEQIEYAAKDAWIMHRIQPVQWERLLKAELDEITKVEFAALPFFVWMERSGIKLDQDKWLKLYEENLKKREEIKLELTLLTGAKHAIDPAACTPYFMWSSNLRVLRMLQDKGHKIEDVNEQTLVMLNTDDPVVSKLLEFREYQKKCTTYGEGFLKYVHPLTGRIHPHIWQIGAAESGRTSCSDPNLQNLPRDKAFRYCFVGENDQLLMGTDYDQIEFRIVAQVAPEQRLIDAFINDEDVHSLTASLVTGKPIDQVTKVGPESDRQLAKIANYGLSFGMGAKHFREYAKKEFKIMLTLQQAYQLRQKWLEAYPGIQEWHKRQTQGPTETRTLGMRRILNVERFSQKLALPVQGSAIDGLKRAMALLWWYKDKLPSSAKPVITVHDELVIEATSDDMEQTKHLVEKYMIEGMEKFLTDVPVTVESTIGPAWGKK